MSSGMARFKTVSESFVTTAAWTRGVARGANRGAWSLRYEAVTSCDKLQRVNNTFRMRDMRVSITRHSLIIGRRVERGLEDTSLGLRGELVSSCQRALCGHIRH